ncbi:MAG: thiamine phosphate synthase [Lachnospiraceae bacterium]|nr:thiamine phosphate synthase [Lachnospiraceae bacterium]
MIMYMYKKILVTNRKICKIDLISQLNHLAQLWDKENAMKPERIILREKDLSKTQYEMLAKEVLQFCEKNQLILTAHTHLDITKKIACKHLHLSFPAFREYVPQIAKMKAEQTLCEVGVSVHSIEEAIYVMRHGGDYLTAGHIFATDCKKGLPPRGLSFLEKICREVPIPVYAIGGIQLRECEKMEACRQVGVAGVCIMSDYMKL